MLGLFDWIFIGMFAGFCVLDFLLPARRFPYVRGWRITGVVSLVVYYLLAGYTPILWDTWLGEYTLFDASGLSYWITIPVGFLVLQFGIYVWHRTMHSVEPLWRAMHQMHHAAERVDIYGAFYFHPFDMIGWTFLGSVMLVGVFGLDGGAAAIVNTVAAFCGMFQHSNIKTPHWLGYVVTRPESHSVHHQRGHHANNYGDIPLFDILFGTFVNPKSWQNDAGFFAGSSLRISKLLFWRKVA
ncbi:sterol desaturase family protein [Kordiimonas aestuarii]|uniref:sterol desaturase family protein n=1 Tax=Kordiimonas aestuarii TaxID=1005925 RepID=UPI0021D21700|nr:sterol desaturase family protein [Kordiimonas aestuarii]